MKFSEFKNKKWVKLVSNKYLLIIILIVVWMVVFDTNSFFIHNELNNEIDNLKDNKEFYKDEIDHDKTFIEKMKDSNEQEKFAREKYYMKKDNEDIFIIEHQDSLKNKGENE